MEENKHLNYLKRTITVSSDIINIIYNFIKTNQTIKTSVNNVYSGLVDGMSTAVTNLPNIIQDKKNYNILKTSLALNLMFCLPILLYYKFSRLLYCMLLSNNNEDFDENSYLITDYIFCIFFIQKFYKDYIGDNLFLFTTTSWLPKNKNTNVILKKCNCSQKTDNKNVLLKSLNFTAEQFLLLFSQNHIILKFSYYLLFSLSNGRSLIRNNINKENSCEKHQNKHLNSHTSYAIGLGMAYLALINLSYSIIAKTTGVHSLFLYDALSSILYQIFLINSNFSCWHQKKDLYSLKLHQVLNIISSELFNKHEPNIILFIEKCNSKIDNNQQNESFVKIKYYSKEAIKIFIIPNNLQSIDKISRNKSFQLFCYYNYSIIKESLDLLITKKQQLDATREFQLPILYIILKYSYPTMLAKIFYFLVESKLYTVENIETVSLIIDKAIYAYKDTGFDIIDHEEIKKTNPIASSNSEFDLVEEYPLQHDEPYNKLQNK